MATITDEAAGGGRVCPYQMAFMLDNWIRRLFQNPVKLLADYIREGNTVVDLGCGPGFFTIDMAEMVGSTGQVIAVDLQPGMLDRVRKKAFRKRVADRIAIHQCHVRIVSVWNVRLTLCWPSTWFTRHPTRSDFSKKPDPCWRREGDCWWSNPRCMSARHHLNPWWRRPGRIGTPGRAGLP